MFWNRARQAVPTWRTPEFVQLLTQSGVDVAEKQAAAIEKWGLGSGSRWNADLVAGTITFEFDDRVLSSSVEVLGTYAPESDTWLWGWANEGLPETVTGAARAVRDLASRPGLSLLAEPRLSHAAELADDLASIGVQASDLAGFYRGSGAKNHAYLGFRDFEIIPR